MIRCSKTSIKQSNIRKKSNIALFIDEYKRVEQEFIDVLWKIDKVPSLIPIEITSSIKTWLSARAIQCAAKQASGVVRGTRKKAKDRIFRIKELNKDGKFKQARKLKDKHDKISLSKPIIKNCQPELDGRFIDIQWLDSPKKFDGFIRISSIGNGLKIKIPFKKHKHFNKLNSEGKLNAGLRLHYTHVTFMFNIDDPIKKEQGEPIGIDIGQTTILSCSNGLTVDTDIHGHSYKSICNVLSKKKRGSKSFKRTQDQRKNFIRWSLNQIKWEEVKQVNCENIKNLRYKKRSSRSLRHWNYKELFEGLELKCETIGVRLVKLNPTYTSQRCSKCGWVQKRNRNGKHFKCAKCNYTSDADLNASINISLPLIELNSKQQWSSKINLNGFYWSLKNEEPIVPHANKN